MSIEVDVLFTMICSQLINNLEIKIELGKKLKLWVIFKVLQGIPLF